MRKDHLLCSSTLVHVPICLQEDEPAAIWILAAGSLPTPFADSILCVSADQGRQRPRPRTKEAHPGEFPLPIIPLLIAYPFVGFIRLPSCRSNITKSSLLPISVSKGSASTGKDIGWMRMGATIGLDQAQVTCWRDGDGGTRHSSQGGAINRKLPSWMDGSDSASEI